MRAAVTATSAHVRVAGHPRAAFRRATELAAVCLRLSRWSEGSSPEPDNWITAIVGVAAVL